MPDYITDNMTQLMDAPALSLSSKTLDPTFPSVVEKVIIIIERFIVIPTALLIRFNIALYPLPIIRVGGIIRRA